MPKYLSLFKYSTDGNKGFLKDRAEAREAAVRKALDSVGGKFESMYWTAGGEYTGALIAHFPDSATAAAFTTVVNASGALSHFTSVELLTSSEIDGALRKTMTYRPPGG